MTTTPQPLKTYRKDPDAILDYGFDWSDWLASGEVITDSAWTADVAGLTIGADSFSDTATTVWISGGEDGAAYLLTNRITTSDDRIDDRTILINVVQR